MPASQFSFNWCWRQYLQSVDSCPGANTDVQCWVSACLQHAQYTLKCQSSAVSLCLQAMEDHEAMCQHALGSDYVTLATVLEQLQANIRTDHNLNCGVRQGAFAAALSG